MDSRPVLITRPATDAAALVRALADLGHAAYSEPLLDIVNIPFALPPEARFLVFTSANGVRAVAAHTADRSHGVYCVGDRTAAQARDAGWRQVKSAGGDIRALQALLDSQQFSGSETVVHCRGFDVSGNIELKSGVLKSLVVYRAEKARAFSPACLEILEGNGFAAALFFSPRTAETFVDLIRAGGLEETVRTTKALCIADSVLKSLRGLPWADVQVAAQPTRQAVLALLDPRFNDRQDQDGDDD